MKKTKTKTTSQLKKDLDKVFSIYIRTKYADDNGIVKCYTCPYRDHYKKLQNGHLVSRYFTATRYDERNCRPQCMTCNIWRNGMTPVFSANLEKELGEGITAELYQLAQKIVKDYPYTPEIERYKNIVKSLPNYEQ
jgi:hypothetical protein